MKDKKDTTGKNAVIKSMYCAIIVITDFLF